MGLFKATMSSVYVIIEPINHWKTIGSTLESVFVEPMLAVMVIQMSSKCMV